MRGRARVRVTARASVRARVRVRVRGLEASGMPMLPRPSMSPRAPMRGSGVMSRRPTTVTWGGCA